jgi:hypothetical protein
VSQHKGQTSGGGAQPRPPVAGGVGGLESWSWILEFFSSEANSLYMAYLELFYYLHFLPFTSFMLISVTNSIRHLLCKKWTENDENEKLKNMPYIKS